MLTTAIIIIIVVVSFHKILVWPQFWSKVFDEWSVSEQETIKEDETEKMKKKSYKGILFNKSQSFLFIDFQVEKGSEK